MKNSAWCSQRIHLQKIIKSIRKDSGLTQKQLATSLNKPQSYISKYESGEKRLDLIELREICMHCGVSLEDFCQKFESSLKG